MNKYSKAYVFYFFSDVKLKGSRLEQKIKYSRNMLRNSKLSEYKIKKILRCFCLDLGATKTAKISEINRNTINRYFNIFREKIVKYSLLKSAEIGEFELDESYYGAKG